MSASNRTELSMPDLLAARTAWLRGDAVPDGVRPVVLRSWERCRAYGVDPENLRRQYPDTARLERARARHEPLLSAAAPFLDLITETLATEPHVAVVADPDGLVLDARIGPELDDLDDSNIFVGASWHERDIGCNGIGTCLALGEPVILIGPEHFHSVYGGWTCIGVPLRDAGGTIVGALDFSVPNEHTHPHAWGWILSVARGIELSLARGVPAGPAEAGLAAGPADDPAAAIQGVLDLLADGETTLPTHATFLEAARAQLRHVQNRLADAVERLRRSEHDARRELAELQSIYETAPIGLCVLDCELRFVRTNDRLAEINGIPAADHIGRTVRELLPGLADAAEPLLLDVIARGEPVLNYELVGETPAQPGVIRHWIEHFLPLKDDDGQVLGVSIVVEEVTEQKRAEREIREAFETTRRAVEERDSVLAVVSHDLRNPLNTISMAAELFTLDLPPDRRQLQAVLIRRSVERMTRLLEDLLEVSSIEAGGLRLVRRSVAVDSLVLAAVEALSIQAEARGQQMAASVPPRVHVRADRKRVLQVLDNLIANAIRHTPDGGSIRVIAHLPEDGAKEVRFTVEDSGPGVPDADRARVFDRFWQGARTDRAGVGLGLSIARGIVEAHGGRIWVEGAEGTGAAFNFTLPRAEPPAEH